MTRLVALFLLTAIAVFGEGSVIHVVTIKWKPGTTEKQIQEALDGVKTLKKEYNGIKHVWIRSIKVQGDGITHALAMEFDSEKALTDYAGSTAQEKWYKLYMPIRESSTTYDITN